MESIILNVGDLCLDPENPRLPEALLGSSEPTLIEWLNREAVLNELAASMLENGFFPHEPLIVLRAPMESQKHIVVEGNRRFAALSILLSLPSALEAGLDFDFQVPPTADQLDRLHAVPCFMVDSREEVRKFLGFRHIGGVRTWSPESKARYLNEEVERVRATGSSAVFREVGRLVGSNAAGVRGPYIALHILRSARDDLGLDVEYVMQNRFGVWNRMMNSGELRSYIGFGDALTVDEVDTAIRSMTRERLAEVLSDLTPAGGQRRAVLSDSRDVTAYAAVLQNPKARQTLRTYLDLGLAKQVIERASLAQKIRSLARSVELLLRDLDDAEIDEEVIGAGRALMAQAQTLLGGLKVRAEANLDD